MDAEAQQTRIPGYCALCWSSCGCVSVVADGRLMAVEPDPSHPTGQALCGKGQAAPDYVYSDARVLYPMRRTRPKGDPDPGWERISWDEALDETVRNLERIRARSGTESVAFSITTSAGTAMQDGYAFVERLRQAFGTPNAVASIELCDFAKDFMYPHTFGTQLPPSEVDKSDCIVLWGHNPSTTWIALATRIAAARRRGARLVVIDPVRVGFAAKADEWLRVRPGSDGALALSLAHVMIEEGLYDEAFVREWTNGPFLVREDNGAFLTGADLDPGGNPDQRIAWETASAAPLRYDCRTGAYLAAERKLALTGRFEVAGVDGAIACRPAFDRYRALCAEYPPERAVQITWVDASQIRGTARLIGSAKAVSCSTWAGLEMHSNTSQTGRAIACLYALTGCFDAPGGNVVMSHVPVRTILGRELMPQTMREKSLGLETRSLGPESIFSWITADALYKAVLERKPYGVDALVSFGLNLLVSHADGARGARALDALDFMVHADLFMTPTATHADIFLPVNTPWEREGLKTDFYVDQRACAHVQLRQRVVEPLGESRSDAAIALELAQRLGLGDAFWEGNADAAYAEILEPSGVTVAELRAAPAGKTLPLATRYRKYAGDGSGPAQGFATPSRKVELYSETLFAHGYDPLPGFVEPAMGPASRPDLAKDFPLVLTDTKSNHFVHSQYRHVARLRRHEREPRVEMHPDTAAARGIAEGDWVNVTTPHGGAKMQARFSNSLHPGVVRAAVGWWQSCAALGLAGYDAESEQGANLNRLIGNADADPIGGCVPHKSYLCEIALAGS
ncbi:MAG: molybdopterin-dependent oxidoreductase [Gammaproteobacteria bacterium]